MVVGSRASVAAEGRGVPGSYGGTRAPWLLLPIRNVRPVNGVVGSTWESLPAGRLPPSDAS